jgi:hypothetical protein
MSRFRNLALALVTSGAAAIGLQATPAHAAVPTTRALLVGELGIEGGAPPGGFHPTAGVVEVEFARLPLVIEKKVGRSGQFRIPLGPGTYTVIGCGPGANGGPNGICSQPQTITLAPGQVDFLELVWAHVP